MRKSQDHREARSERDSGRRPLPSTLLRDRPSSRASAPGNRPSSANDHAVKLRRISGERSEAIGSSVGRRTRFAMTSSKVRGVFSFYRPPIPTSSTSLRQASREIALSSKVRMPSASVSASTAGSLGWPGGSCAHRTTRAACFLIRSAATSCRSIEATSCPGRNEPGSS